MDPADWDNGTARLSLEEEAAYLRIVNSIHKHKGPVPDVDRVLAGMFRTSTRKARALVLALMSAGKVVIEDGAIFLLGWSDVARPGIPAEIKADVRSEAICAYCGATEAVFEIDHIFPWSRGGSHERHNLTLACMPCNRSKGDKTLEEWRGRV
jgi:hypothetical protein